VVLYGLARSRLAAGHALPLALLLLVLFAGGAVHVVRVRHPVARGEPTHTLQDAFDGASLNPARWEVSLGPGALVRVGAGAATLDVPSNVTGSLSLVRPQPRWWLGGPARQVLPMSYSDTQLSERLTLRASVQRANTYFILLDAGTLIVQVTCSSIRISARDVRGNSTDSEAPLPLGDDSKTGDLHEWRIVQGRTGRSLVVDGKVVWSRPDTVPLGLIRLGETFTDAEHGGRLTLDSLTYERWWER